MVTVTPRVVPDLLSAFITYKIEGAEVAMKHLLDHMISMSGSATKKRV